MLFRERAKIAIEILAKQPPATLEQVRAQVQELKERSSVKEKKCAPINALPRTAK
jgi:hypothetical protein